MSGSDSSNTTSLSSLVTSLTLNVAIGAVLLAAWAGLRRCFPDVYAPRWVSARDGVRGSAWHEWRHTDPTARAWMLRKPSDNILRLMVQLVRYSDAEFIASAGVDAYMVLAICRIGFQFFLAVATVYGFAVLLPLNLRGGGESVSGMLERISIANLPANSRYLWAHAVSVYVFTTGLVLLIIRAFNRFIPLRYTWMTVPQAASYTCLITDLPARIIDDHSLHKMITELYPQAGDVQRVCMVTHSERLQRAYEAQEAQVLAVNTKVETALRKRKLGHDAAIPATVLAHVDDDIAAVRTRSREIRALRAFGDEDVAAAAGAATGMKVTLDPVERIRQLLAGSSYNEESSLRDQAGEALGKVHLDSENDDVGEQRTAALYARALRRGIYAPTSVAFVTFGSLAVANIAAQVTNAVPAFSLRATTVVSRAPQAREIVWRNISMPDTERTTRRRIVFGLMLLLTATYTIPIAAVSAILTLDSLAKLLPGVSIVNANPVLRGFLEGFLPTLALRIFLAILPMITQGLARYGGARTLSDILMDSFLMYFVFSVWTTFFAVTLAGTAFQALDDLINSPGSVLKVLSGALPHLAAFYAAYIGFQAFISLPLALLDPLRLVLWLLGGAASRGAVQDHVRRIETPGMYGYDVTLAGVALIFLIGTVFTSINPVLSPVCCLYFGVAMLVFRYDLLYVRTNRFQTGGWFFPRFVSCVFVALIIYQLVMIGILSLKTAAGPTAFLIPAPFLTMAAWGYVEQRLRRAAQYLPLQAARAPGAIALHQLSSSAAAPDKHGSACCSCCCRVKWSLTSWFTTGAAARGVRDARVLGALTLMKWWLHTRAKRGAQSAGRKRGSAGGTSDGGECISAGSSASAHSGETPPMATAHVTPLHAAAGVGDVRGVTGAVAAAAAREAGALPASGGREDDAGSGATSEQRSVQEVLLAALDWRSGTLPSADVSKLSSFTHSLYLWAPATAASSSVVHAPLVPHAAVDAMDSIYLHPALRAEFDSHLLPRLADSGTSVQPADGVAGASDSHV